MPTHNPPHPCQLVTTFSTKILLREGVWGGKFLKGECQICINWKHKHYRSMSVVIKIPNFGIWLGIIGAKEPSLFFNWWELTIRSNRNKASYKNHCIHGALLQRLWEGQRRDSQPHLTGSSVLGPRPSLRHACLLLCSQRSPKYFKHKSPLFCFSGVQQIFITWNPIWSLFIHSQWPTEGAGDSRDTAVHFMKP